MSNDSIVKFRPFDNVECCFDIVAVFDNNVAGFGNIVAKNGNNVEATFETVETVERIVQLVAFDNVASTLLLVWTGLKAVYFVHFNFGSGINSALLYCLLSNNKEDMCLFNTPTG